MLKENNINPEKANPTDISVVIPVYNSEKCIEELSKHLTAELNAFPKTYEIIYVNDGSMDKSWEMIVDSCAKYKNIKGVDLRKNFGQDNAIMAGLNYVRGNAIIIMDDDLQHNPKDIPTLLAELEKGFDVCYANFRTMNQALFKNFGSWFNGKVANIILKKPKEIYLSPFKAIRKTVVEEIKKYNGPYPYVDGLIFRITDNIVQVPIEHHTRYAGKGNYNLRKSVSVWLKLATNFSVFPLRIAALLGFSASIMGLILMIYFIARYFIYNAAPSGWPSLIVTILFLGGIQLVTIGIIGEYIGRLFLHQSGHPQYVVEKMFENDKEQNKQRS